MKQLLLVLATVLIAFAQQSDPWEGVSPHDVPACHRTGGKDAAPCKCRDMVTSVQLATRNACYEKTLAKNPEDRNAWYECLRTIPDHCSIISYDGQYGEHYGEGEGMSQRCRTRCKPERCGCQIDPKCPSHEEEMRMQQEEDAKNAKKSSKQKNRRK